MAATMKTHVGLVRQQNEDAAWYDEAHAIYAVADGMGGHQAGEVASALAIEAVKRLAQSGAKPDISPMREMVFAAHEAIYTHALRHRECSGMGTTLSVLWRAGHYAYIAHVGDSRIYRLRDGELEQITQDHSFVEELVRAGVLTREEARVHPRRNIITRALGTRGENTPDMLASDVQPGDVWLLCSDGLNGMVDDAVIRQTLADEPIEQAADTLIAKALEAGGSDNVTVVLYRCEEG